MPVQAITPFLWFDHEAEEAANFYMSVFPDSRIVKVARYGQAGPGPAGSVMTVEFQLHGQSFVALNGGPTALPKLLSDPDPARSTRVMKAMLTMKKLDLHALQRAYDGA